MGNSLKKVLGAVASMGRHVRTLAAVIFAVLVAHLDFATGPNLAFSVFYLIPIAVAAWYGGKGAGLAVAALSGVLWFLAETHSSPTVGLPVLLWNGFSRLAIFAGLALLLARLQKERSDLERANDQLEQRNRDLDAFAGRVAHDLRNAMAPVSMAAPLLRSQSSDPQKIAMLADRVDASCRKALLIISSLLALAKAEQPLADDSSTQLLPAVNEVMGDLDDEIRLHAIDVFVEVDGGLCVRCDPGLLHIVLANLIGNAVKYLGSHPLPRSIKVSAATHGQSVEFMVADNGPGIPLDEQAKIFEPFYRGRLSGSDGTGIGLATVKRIVDSQGGIVGLHDDGSNATVFRVSLPAAGLASG